MISLMNFDVWPFAATVKEPLIPMPSIPVTVTETLAAMLFRLTRAIPALRCGVVVEERDGSGRRSCGRRIHQQELSRDAAAIRDLRKDHGRVLWHLIEVGDRQSAEDGFPVAVDA